MTGAGKDVQLDRQENHMTRPPESLRAIQTGMVQARARGTDSAIAQLSFSKHKVRTSADNNVYCNYGVSLLERKQDIEVVRQDWYPPFLERAAQKTTLISLRAC